MASPFPVAEDEPGAVGVSVPAHGDDRVVVEADLAHRVRLGYLPDCLRGHAKAPGSVSRVIALTGYRPPAREPNVLAGPALSPQPSLRSRTGLNESRRTGGRIGYAVVAPDRTTYPESTSGAGTTDPAASCERVPGDGIDEAPDVRGLVRA